MADVKISALPASTTPLAGTEVLPIVQSSTTKQVSVANLTAGRAVSALSLTSTTTLGVTGVSTLTGGAVIQGLTVGLGANAVAGNTAVGVTALALNTTGNSNVGIGENANTNNLTGSNNTALGRWALINNTGASNIGLGANSGTALTTGSNNTIIGSVTGTAGLSDTVIIAAGAAERMRIDSSGNVGIGGSAAAYTKVSALGFYPTSSATSIVYDAAGTVPSGTTATARIYGTSISIAASTTVSSVQHFYAQSPGLFSGAAITNQYGFLAESNLTNATNNFGFYGGLASGTGRYNLYMAGTADNYLGGNLQVAGDTTLAAYTETIVASGTVGASATLAITAGTVLTATLTSATACTITLPPVSPAGKSFILLLKQPASGTATTATFITSPASHIMWNSSGAPTITATVGKMDILTFVSDGTNWYGSYSQGYTP